MANSVWKWKKIGDLLVMCASEGDLTDGDYEPCLELHRTNQVKRGIFWAVGSVRMTPMQRRQTGDAMGDHRAANITDSAVTRGIITAFAWMGKPWSAFTSAQLRAAIDFVGVPTGYTSDDVLSVLTALKAEVLASPGAKSA